MPWITPCGKCVGCGLRDYIQLGHWKIGLRGEALHDFIQTRKLFARDGLCAARIERDLVREKIGERVGGNRKAQADDHTVPATEILSDNDKKQRQRRQQKRCSQNPHLPESLSLADLYLLRYAPRLRV